MGKTRIGDLVSDNLISTDIGNDRVGIGSTLPSSKLDVDGDANVSGVVTATSFSGSGTNLSGIVTSITAGSNISVDSSTGSVTITGLANTANIVSDTIDTGSLNVTGVSTFSDDVSIAENKKIIFGDEDLYIYHTGGTAFIDNNVGQIRFKSLSSMLFYSESGLTGGVVEDYAKFLPNAAVELYYDGVKKFETASNGVNILSTDTGSSAGPELTLYRNSSSPAPGDYLGQIMFKGENSNGGEENYAKITGKISDETLGTEDGLIETAIKGDGSFTIVSRQRSDELQLINGVGLSVDGDSTFTGGIDVDGHTELDNVNVSGVVTTSKLHVDPVGSGFTYTEDLVVLGNARVTGILSIGTSSIVLDSNAKTIRGINEIRIDSDEDDDDTPVIIRQRRGRAFFRKTRRNHSNQLIEVEEEASVGIGTTVSVNTSGIITASSFYGDGSNLTGLTHSQVSGVMVNLVEDTTPQLGGNLDLNSNDITGTGNINITGSGTFSGNVSIAGTLTYEDVTNVDSVGLITARSGVDVTGNISVTGTVDGRDIASDGSKLDGIESGATADQTAAEILTLIKTVDGNGSGLDADTLDNLGSGAFLRSNAADTATGDITFRNNKLIFDNTTFSTFDWQNYQADNGDLTWTVGGTSGPEMELESDGSNYLNAELRVGGSKVWTTGNDGTGSGLDADTVDGIQGASFLRSDAADTMTGRLTFANTGTSATFNYFLNASNDAGTRAVHFVNGSARTTDGGANAYTIRNDGGPLILGRTNFSTLIKGSGDLTYNSNEVWHAGNDGSGSGLDADTVDGIQLSGLIRSQTGSVLGSMLTLGDQSSNYRWNNNTDGRPADAQANEFGTLLHLDYDGSRASQFAWDIQADNLYLRTLTYSTDTGTAWKKVWTDGNDGSGSGLDADTVDGIQGASFLRSDANDTFTGVLTGNTSGYARINGSDKYHSLIIRGTVSGTSTQTVTATNIMEFIEYGALWRFREVTATTNKVWFEINSTAPSYDGNTVWHAGNDGSGSGLDADTLDGISSASFLRSDANDTISAIITGHTSDTEVFRLRSSTYSTKYVYYGGWSTANSNDISRIRSSGNLHIDSPANGHLYLNWYASNRTIHLGNTGQVVRAAGSNTVWHAGNDGSGSGLDADLLDGIQGSAYLRSNTTDEYDGGQLTIRSNSANGHYWGAGLEYYSSAWRHTNDNSWGFVFRNSGGILDIYSATAAGTAGATATYKTFRIGGSSSLLQYDGNNIWHAGNDGAGSGLDADLLDGQQGSYYQNASNLNAGTIPDARIPDTITPVTLVTTKEIRTSNGSEVVINAGESTGKIAGQTGEIVYVNAEQGLRVCTPSVSNWGSGYVEQRTNITGGGIFFHRNTTAMGEITTSDTTWLRINQNTAKNIYTPRYIRADGGFFVDGTSKGINGSGNFIGGTIAGASDYGTLLRSNANDIATGSYLFQRNNAAIANGSYAQGNNHIELRTNDASNPILGFHRSGYTATALYHSGYGSGSLRMRNADGNDGPIFSTFNDGAGSGLDADTVDGIQGSALAPIASPTFTGNLTIPDAIVHTGDTNTYIQFHGNDLFRVVIAGAEVQEWGNNYTLLSDNDTMRLGSGSDFRMWFNGADTIFRNYAHANGDIIFQGETSGGSNQNILIMKTDSTRTYNILYENNAERLRTVSTGVNITGALVATGDVTAFSDITLKEDIEVIPNALDKVSQIRGVTFTRKDLDDESRKSGVIAQEVEKVLPEVVTTNEDGIKTVAYGNLVGLLIESIKELKAEVETLKKEHN